MRRSFPGAETTEPWFRGGRRALRVVPLSVLLVLGQVGGTRAQDPSLAPELAAPPSPGPEPAVPPSPGLAAAVPPPQGPEPAAPPSPGPEPEVYAPRTSELSLGGHGLLLATSHCDVDNDVVGCQQPFLAGGFDLAGQLYVEPGIGLGARASVSIGSTGSTRGSRSQWLLRLLGDLVVASRDSDDGLSFAGEYGLAMLFDRLAPNPVDGEAPAHESTTYLAPVLGVGIGYDFVVYDRLTFGVVLRGQLMYLVRLRSDIESPFDGFEDGLVPILELGLRASMSQ